LPSLLLVFAPLQTSRAEVDRACEVDKGHGRVEKRTIELHAVRDWTLREDASRIRKGSGPEVMAALRNIVIFLFKRFGHKNATAATWHCVCNPEKSLELLSILI
jgi:hypothetical protein